MRSEEELIVLARLADDETPAYRHDPSLQARQATPADATLYARAVGTESARTFTHRLTSSTHCFLVLSGPELLHASWVTMATAWTRELRACIAPPPGDAYVYESFTRAEARGRGVYPFALGGICVWAAGHGLGSVWVAVDSSNEPSRKAIGKAGFEPRYTIRYGRRLGRLSLSVEAPPGGTIPSLTRNCRG